MTGDQIRDRIASVCASDPFGFAEAVTPFDFSKQPTGQIDRVFRLTMESDGVKGGFNYSEERTDRLEIWLARKHAGAPKETYRALLVDVSSLRAAVIRDGTVTSGDYSVPDGGEAFGIETQAGAEYAVLRLTIPVNYETSV